jgi:alpha-beta hydrolase superfamily lysophospholipase
VNIASQTAYDPNAEGGMSATGPTYIHEAATQMLGGERLASFSPLRVARRITAHVLLAQAEQDPLIPPQQQSDLCRRLAARCAGSLRLAAGPLAFPHASVARTALSAFRRAETELASAATRRRY